MFFVGPWDVGKLVGLLYRPPMEFVKCGNWLRTSSMEWMLVVAYGISGVDVCGFRVLWAAGALGGRFFGVRLLCWLLGLLVCCGPFGGQWLCCVGGVKSLLT